MRTPPASSAEQDSEGRRLRAMRLLAGKMRSLVMAGRFEEAFDVGDRVMASRPGAEIIEALIYPIDQGLATFPETRFYELLSIIERRPRPARFEAWYVLMTSVLLDRLRWSDEAIRASGKLLALPRRYGWMRWHRGMLLLNNHWDSSAARADFEAVLASAPRAWKAKALLAEIDLSEGKTSRALRSMSELLRAVDEPDLAAVRAWRGELLLWAGRYRRALPDLDWAVERKSPLALCWRGGCYVKLGRFPEALWDLDAQIRDHPDDLEARVWRAEAKRLMGSAREALEELDAVCRRSNDLWAHVNRGLARASLGDRAGLWSDYSGLLEWIRHYFVWKLGREIGPESPSEDIVAQLEAILKAARGVRRCNKYLFPLWMPSPAKG